MAQKKGRLALLPTLILLGCSGPETGSENPELTTRAAGTRDIILITIDTLRRDHMSIYGYERPTTPNLDRFFADQAVFTRAYANSTSTPQSVASILSGLLPQEHRIRVFYQLLDASVPVLPDYLRPTYQSAAFVSNAVLTDEAMEMGVRFDHFDDFVADRESSRRVYERNAADTTNAALEWLANHRDPKRPLFLWIHYIDPHGPYDPPTYWRRSFTHNTPEPISANAVPAYLYIGDDGLEYVDAYDEEIAYMDSEVGRFFDGYGADRPMDDALIIFTADHGETMMEHEHWFQHGYHVYEELTGIPLMIRGPDVSRGLHTNPVSTIDIAPTLLSYAGIPVPDHFIGHSLLESDFSSVERMIFSEALTHEGQWRGVVQGNNKFVTFVHLTGDVPEMTRNRRFDLLSDPGETRPKPWKDRTGAVMTELKSLVETDPDPAGRPVEFARGSQLAGPKIRPNIGAQGLEALRALGYIE